jgi:hypothetical protein
MTLAQARAWANSLNINGSGWRLPRNSPINGSPSDWNYNRPFVDVASYDGTADVGYNNTSPGSELAYMYYVNLGLKAIRSPSGDYMSDYGLPNLGPGQPSQADIGLVKNLQSRLYWYDTRFSSTSTDTAWAFYFPNGGQGSNCGNSDCPPGRQYYAWAWAVRDGDVTAIPVPGSVALLAGGLALLGVVTRRRERLAVEK